VWSQPPNKAAADTKQLVSIGQRYHSGGARLSSSVGGQRCLVQLSADPLGGRNGAEKKCVRFLKKSEFFAKLQRRFPFDTHGYFYDGRCSRFSERRLSERASVKRLVRVTERHIASSPPETLLAFNDQIAGWRAVPRTRRFSPLALEPALSIQELVEGHMHFRDPERYEDNYYLTTPALEWFINFCHHGDWHFYGSKAVVGRLSLA